MFKSILFIISFLFVSNSLLALDFIDLEDEKILEQMEQADQSLQFSELEKSDDLQSLKDDIGEFKEIKLDKVIFEDIDREKELDSGENKADSIKITTTSKKEEVFEVGEEEKNLLDLAKKIEGRIPKEEWNEIALLAKEKKYVIVKGDTLWDISKRFFGSGFYYAKVWSLNPQITNPHEIEPSMVLLFDTGSMDSPPRVTVGKFHKDVGETIDGAKLSFVKKFELTNFGEDTTPEWLNLRAQLHNDGGYFIYASEETYDDLIRLGKVNLVEEYKRYTPPYVEIMIREPGDQYDSTGFDKSSRIIFNYSEGFHLNTFVTTNVVQDLGVISNLRSERSFISNNSFIYVKFDADVKVKPGDLFSIYKPEGKVSHEVSDRSGYRYSILAQIRASRKINDKWECQVEEIAGVAQRGDRVTIYTPKIKQIYKTFNKRKIEAAVISSYNKTLSGLHFGNIVYLDRGRADGVGMGNIFEVYSSTDKGMNSQISIDPTYKIGEMTVISLTDNFATALVSQSNDVSPLGAIVISKTEEDAMRAERLKKGRSLGDIKEIEDKALEELDVELNFDNISEDLLKKADQIKLTEDELDELERQERERSVIKDHERDLRDLERLESELEMVEKQLIQVKLDEDELLDNENLDNIEGRTKGMSKDAFQSMNDLESNFGKKYLDEDINSKDNPYGLTPYDIEEINELLNSKENGTKQSKILIK